MTSSRQSLTCTVRGISEAPRSASNSMHPAERSAPEIIPTSGNARRADPRLLRRFDFILTTVCRLRVEPPLDPDPEEMLPGAQAEDLVARIERPRPIVAA